MSRRLKRLLEWIDQALEDSADATIGLGMLGLIAVFLAFMWGRFGQYIGSALFLVSIIVLVILTVAFRHSWSVLLAHIRNVVASRRPASLPDRQSITNTSGTWRRLRAVPNLIILAAASLLVLRVALDSGLSAYETARCLAIFYLVILVLKPLERRLLHRLNQRDAR